MLYLPVLLLLFYLYAFWRLGKGLLQLPQPVNDQSLPHVTVIVSMHNEESNARSCLDALLKQEYPADKLDFIIINDRSSDATGEILDRSAKNEPRLTILHQTKVTDGFAPKKQAIDTAVRKAKGEIILLTDADGRPGTKWVRETVRYFTPETGLVIGYAPYTTAPPFRRWYFQLAALEYFTHAAVAAATTGLGYPATCVGTNMAYRRELFLQLDGFGPFKSYLSGDDDLFLQRVREETDWKIHYAASPECHVQNAPPNSWKKFYHQRIRYASKGFVYPFPLKLALTGFYLLNLGTLIVISGSLFGWFQPLAGIGLWGIKLAGEIRFMRAAMQRLHDERHLSWLLPGGFLLMPYIVWFGFMAQIQRFEWAGMRG